MTKDVSSHGRRHRTYSPKFIRTLHLLSDLEDHAVFVSEARGDVVRNYEQVALLPLGRTQSIAAELCVRHPRAPGAPHDEIMTTDQVWVVTTANGEWLQPVFVKYACDLQDERVQEKLSIERRYWEMQPKCLPLHVFSETSATSFFVRNWSLIRGTLHPDFFASFSDGIVERMRQYLRSPESYGMMPLGDLYSAASADLSLFVGECIPAIHNLIAIKRWGLDLDAALLSPQTPISAFVTARR